MEAIIDRPRIRWLYLIVAVLLFIMAFSIPVYADIFSGQASKGYVSIGGSSSTHLIIGTPASSYFSIVTGGFVSASIQANSATAITIDTARLNAKVLTDGGENVSVRFGYGAVSQTAVNFNNYTTLTSWVGGYHNGSPVYVNVTGLDTGVVYYYRAQVNNSYGAVASTNEVSFTTIGSVGNALYLTAIPSDTTVTLTWSPASGSTHTVVRYRTDAYPSSVTDGTSAYNGSGW